MKTVVLFYPRPWPGRTMSGRLPYSLLMLHSYLADTDYNVIIIDERTEKDVAAVISSLDGDLLCFGISSFTGIQIKNGLAIAQQLRAAHPETPIVWGGIHPTTLPDQTLGHPLVDIIVRGQGEVTFKELVFALDKKRDLSGIKGVSYKEDGKLIHNPDRKPSSVISEFKLCFDAVDVEKYIYQKPFAGRAHKTIGIITSLGCPNKCGFCAVACVYKQRVFLRNVSTIIEEIDYMVEKYGITSITIDDDNFFVSSKRVREFCEKLIQKPYDITWDAGVSVNLLLRHYDDDLLALIKRSGCEQLYIGAESGSDQVLQLIGKNAKVQQTYEFVQKMKEVGIRASISSMVGIPDASSDEIFKTIDMIINCREINPDFDFRIFYYTPYPSTALYNRALENGMQVPQSMTDWSEHTLRNFKAPWVKESYRRLVKYFYFYYYPYSGPATNSDSDLPLPGRAVLLLFRFVFANKVFKILASLRVKHRYFKYPADAWFVTQGLRLNSLYGRIVHKNIDVFQQFNA